MQVAKRIALDGLALLRRCFRGMPILVRQRRLLREEHGKDESNAA